MVEAIIVSVNGGVATKTTGRIWSNVEARVGDPAIAPRFEDSDPNGGRKLGGDFARILNRSDERIFRKVNGRRIEFIEALVDINGE